MNRASMARSRLGRPLLSSRCMRFMGRVLRCVLGFLGMVIPSQGFGRRSLLAVQLKNARRARW